MWRTSLWLAGISILAAGFMAARLISAGTVNAAQFHSRLLEIAQEYQGYGRVDDEWRWAPYLCRMPEPSVARFSASGDASTHGRKLYYVFARNRDDYLFLGAPRTDVVVQLVAELGSAPTPSLLRGVEQVVVKESWIPREVPPDTPLAAVMNPLPRTGKDANGDEWNIAAAAGEAYLPYARRDGKLYHASEKAGLYIMYRLSPDTPETDEGWVYGTVTPDARTVTSAGRVASCMGCHTRAPYGRLFGLPKSSTQE